jgi:ribosomal protein L17
MATQVLNKERILTTMPRAMALRTTLDNLITLGKDVSVQHSTVSNLRDEDLIFF